VSLIQYYSLLYHHVRCKVALQNMHVRPNRQRVQASYIGLCYPSTTGYQYGARVVGELHIILVRQSHIFYTCVLRWFILSTWVIY